MPFENNIIIANTINDAWRDAMWCCVRNGHDYIINEGSYQGQIRKQLDYVVIKILKPYTRPLAVQTPENMTFNPTSEEKIEQYFYEYLLDNKSTNENQQYTYAEYVQKQLNKAIAKLTTSRGNTNQAVITIGNEDSINLEHPPCLKVIDFKIINNKLNMNVYMRSWDSVIGMPENLGGLQLLKEYVLNILQQYINVTDGELICYSSGLHIYEMYFSIVSQLCVDKIQVNCSFMQ